MLGRAVNLYFITKYKNISSGNQKGDENQGIYFIWPE
jgi:hypothetical protein